VTLGWLVLAYRSARVEAPLWPVGDGLWAAATVVMPLASILPMRSIVRNPALPNPGPPTPVPAEARGVPAITRHPMMWDVLAARRMTRKLCTLRLSPRARPATFALPPGNRGISAE